MTKTIPIFITNHVKQLLALTYLAWYTRKKIYSSCNITIDFNDRFVDDLYIKIKETDNFKLELELDKSVDKSKFESVGKELQQLLRDPKNQDQVKIILEGILKLAKVEFVVNKQVTQVTLNYSHYIDIASQLIATDKISYLTTLLYWLSPKLKSNKSDEEKKKEQLLTIAQDNLSYLALELIKNTSLNLSQDIEQDFAKTFVINSKFSILPNVKNSYHRLQLLSKIPTNTRAELVELLTDQLINIDHYQTYTDMKSDHSLIHNSQPKTGGKNIIYYGVPGCGKSYAIAKHSIKHTGQDDIEKRTARIVFHPEYTNADFIGCIMPTTKEGTVSYEFIPGPFTEILRKAHNDEKNYYVLIIEELNRGNAPAIFGEVFQLLDRIQHIENDSSKDLLVGESTYGISHPSMAQVIYGKPTRLVRIPANLYIYATMNTSDQNVFTLDTAFQRRWQMELVSNSFDKHKDEHKDKHKHKDRFVPGTPVTWENFCLAVNEKIREHSNSLTSTEDKRLGAYFVTSHELTEKANVDAAEEKKAFASKVLKYLWDDVFKFNRDQIFHPNMSNFEEVFNTFTKTKSDAEDENMKKIDVLSYIFNFDFTTK